MAFFCTHMHIHKPECIYWFGEPFVLWKCGKKAKPDKKTPTRYEAEPFNAGGRLEEYQNDYVEPQTDKIAKNWSHIHAWKKRITPSQIASFLHNIWATLACNQLDKSFTWSKWVWRWDARIIMWDWIELVVVSANTCWYCWAVFMIPPSCYFT